MIGESFENDFLISGELWLIELWFENLNKDIRIIYFEIFDKKGKIIIIRIIENKFILDYLIVFIGSIK